ncbi:MAG: NADH-quinone oxidoreductase subunit N [Chloroflexota bacterium]
MDFFPVLPEILLFVLALIVLGLDLFASEQGKKAVGYVGVAGLLALFVLNLFWNPGSGAPTLGGMLSNDSIAQVFKGLFLLAAALTLLVSQGFMGLGRQGEYVALVIVATAGMSLMASSADLIMLYVAMETTSIALFILAAYIRGNVRSIESGLKYFLFGAFASALMLYGMTLIYGLTGTTGLTGIAAAVAGMGDELILALVGITLLLVGFSFKVSAVPFHMWTPDVYEGAPTPITAFISVASKAAGFAVVLRVLFTAFGAGSVQEEWVALVAAFSMVTMTLGNVVALWQTNIKRLLAYSSIAQAGYMLIGVASASELGVAAVLFYLMTYTLTNVAAFTVIIIFSRVSGSEEIAAYDGLSRRSPYLALAMLLALLSLGGIPPLGGFFGKLYLFSAAIEQGYIWLVVVGVLNSIVALFYYLGVVARPMYVNRSEDEAKPLPVPAPLMATLAVCILGIVVLGVFPTPFFELAQRVAVALF